MKNIYVALDNIRSLFNVGAILRTCSFYGIKKVILIGISGTTKSYYDKQPVLNEKLNKTALGSQKDLKITILPNNKPLIQFAKEKKMKVICVEQNQKSIPLHKFKPQDNSIFVFGHERNGVDKYLLEKSDVIIEIPQIGTHPSLNVATTCGIVIDYIVNNLS